MSDGGDGGGRAPALGASQRRGTSSQNSTSTGRAASSVDHSHDPGTFHGCNGSRCCW